MAKRTHCAAWWRQTIGQPICVLGASKFNATLLMVVTLVCLHSQLAFGQQRVQNGATVGGVAGAVIGGIIGHQNDETPEGALIGGAVGAIAGGLIGRNQENEIQRQQYYQQQAYYQMQQQAYLEQQAVAASGVSVNDVVNMTRSGVSESLIMSHIQTKGVARRLEVSEIIALHQQGVSDHVIASFQAAPLTSQMVARPSLQTTTVVQQPVVVREPLIYSSPVIVHEHYRPMPVYRYPSHHHHRGGTTIRFGF
ncbi:MAG: glycine zipper 2TM domain-containing protein [Planctomycetales bacterium]|nr:glycine zipper 2TM domain-containing protein [Planctomycetales bacterium]